MTAETARHSETLTDGWLFSLGDVSDAASPDFAGAGAWERVRVPHDWAIKGPFDRENDIVRTAIVEDGQNKVYEHTGRTGGLPHVGVAWYRRELELPAARRGCRVLLEFDGVMSNSQVFLNGVAVGGWPYGYSSFCLDLTDAARFGGRNVLAVRVDNPPQTSRWYPGAGIYRNVRLVLVQPLHIPWCGVWVTTPEVSATAATVAVRTEIANSGGAAAEFELETVILGPDGRVVAETRGSTTAAGGTVVKQSLTVPSPVLWDTARPELHTAVSTLMQGGRVVDVVRTRFGIRGIAFHPRNGFQLNGRRVVFNGVCLHHDLGALGIAVNRRALQRQLEIMRDMGCNAIRTSHNPPAPELLELCDEMGFLVLDEAFDEWRAAKCANGYHRLFEEWAEKDLRAMIRRDRNHPCVVMWSIGNEIKEQRLPDGDKVAAFLRDICHDEDPTRPVTAGLNWCDDAVSKGLAGTLDIQGWNYHPQLYQSYLEQRPEWIQYASETASAVSSRGEYFFPAEPGRAPVRDDMQVSSYDLQSPGWGNTPDVAFAAIEDNPALLGEFVWTGFDYLGEPTPYYCEWPSRSSYFGIVDLCGFPKDRYYLYQSHWFGRQVLHLLPHWNWPERVGEITPVHCYTSFPAAELFLNGRSQGVRRKDPGKVYGRYRLVWDEIRYEPGVLRVVGLDAAGKPVTEAEMRTAGPAAAIALAADRGDLRADGDDLAFITVSIRDRDGNLCPRAADLVSFSISGPGELVAVDNGNAAGLESFAASRHKAFNGLCLAVVRTRRAVPGEIILEASAAGLKPARVRLLAS